MTLKAQSPMRRWRQASSAYGSLTPDSSRLGLNRSAVTCACGAATPQYCQDTCPIIAAPVKHGDKKCWLSHSNAHRP